MKAEYLTQAELSNDSLRELFEAAFFDVRLDDDGDVNVRDKYNVIVTPHGPDNSLIRFVCAFGVKEDAGEEAAFAFCNRINDGLIVIRAGMHDDTTLLVDWYLPVVGEISKKTVVQALRKFNELIWQMGQYDTEDIME